MKAAPKNLLIAAITFGLCLLLVALIAVLSVRPSSDAVRQRPSTFFTDETGSRAVLLVLEALAFSPAQWRRPFTDLEPPANAAAATLIVLGPENSLSETEANNLDAWISSGGQLILATDEAWPVEGFSENDPPQDYLARHGLQSRQDAKGAAAISASVLKTVGRGRIIYLPDSYAFSNSTLRTTDNSVWLVGRCNEWGTVVLFDEYHHGFGAKRGLFTLIGMFLASPWGLVSLQLALAGSIYIVGYRRRFGRPAEEKPVERTSPIETVQAIAGLFQSAEADALAVRSMHQYLNRQISSVVGWHTDLSNDDSRERLSSRVSIGRAGLDSYAQAVGKVMGGTRITDVELLHIARAAADIGRSFSHGVGGHERSSVDREPEVGTRASR